MLEDFDGLRKRIMQLYKEREACDDAIKTKDIELVELRAQVDARDEAVTEVEKISNKNLDEYLSQMQEIKTEKQMLETQTSQHMKNLQETIE
jgi:hypothetical protein